jgi:predicted Zn-dependent protease
LLKTLPNNSQSARLYTSAMTQLANFDPINAERSLRQAIEADPDSPLLHWQLSQVLFSNSYSIQAKSEATKAFDLRTSLSESEQWDIEAWRFYVSKEFPQAAETYARLAAEFPKRKALRQVTRAFPVRRGQTG